MIFYLKRPCFLLLGFLLLTGVSRAQEMDPKEKERKSNVINSVIMNSEAMIRGDLMVYRNDFYDGRFFKNVSDRETMEVSGIHRFIFDHEQKKYLHLTRTTYDHLDLKRITYDFDGRSIRSKVDGSLIDVNGKSLRKSDEKLYRVSFVKDEPPFPRFDPRSIGMGTNGFASFEDMKKMAAQLATGNGLLEAKIMADYLELEFIVSTMPERQIDTIEPIQFCNRSNMPLKWNQFMRFPAGTSEVSTTSIQWEEMSNLFIPCLIKRSAVETFYYDDPLRKTPGDLTSTTYLHWFSLNEELPEGLFDLKNLTDMKKFDELIDPVKNEAGKILEVLKKRGTSSSKSIDREHLQK